MSVLCVIPARGGSTRIKRKNVRDFAGRPMLTHALTAALESGVFDHVHVSTEDDEIAAVAAAAGAEPVFRRNPLLADDHTPIRDVVRTELARFTMEGRNFDTVALIYATAVLIEAEDLRGAAVAFAEEPERPLLTVVNVGTPLERLMVNAGGVLRPAISERFANRTQDLTPAYCDAGAFCFFSAATLEADTDGRLALDFRPFVLPKWKGIDIDTEEDWHFAELIKLGFAAMQGGES